MPKELAKIMNLGSMPEDKLMEILTKTIANQSGGKRRENHVKGQRKQKTQKNKGK